MKPLYLLAALAGGLFARPLAASAEPTLAIGSATVAPGATASIAVTLNSEVQNANGVELHLSSASVTPAGGAALAIAPLDVKSLPASLSIAAFDSNQDASGFHAVVVNPTPFNGPLDIVTLKIQAPPTAAPGATYALTLTAKVTDPDGKSIAVRVDGGTLTIAGSSVPPKKGDVNGDGQVNVSDATLALRFAVGLGQPTSLQAAAADVNGDGTVNVSDATLILRAAVGLITL